MTNATITPSQRKEEEEGEKTDEQTSGGSVLNLSDAEVYGKEDTTREGLAAQDDETEYISGLKLTAVTAAVSLCSFLMLLDMSIISTVRLN